MKYSTLVASAAALFASVSAATTPITNRTNTGVEFVSGNYVEFQPGFLGLWLLFYSANNVTLRGIGYLRLRWEVEYWQKSGQADDIIMDYDGTWLPVAGGGGFQMGDSPAPYCNDPSGTCFNGTGGNTDGYVWFTNSHNPWHDEYSWLDGDVYLQIQEGPGAYNVGVVPVTIDDILEDINTNTSDIYHYGVAFDPAESAFPCSVDTSLSTRTAVDDTLVKL